MTPVNRAQEQESARGSYGETHGIFIVLSGFATTDLSVRFRDACQGRSLWKNGRHAAFLYITRPFGFLELYACSCRSPQPNGRSVATEWARKRKKRTSLTLSTDALRPLRRNNRKQRWTWLNSSRISLNSCWRSLTSLISMLRPTFVRNSTMVPSIFSVHCPRDWMNYRMVTDGQSVY